MWATDLNSFSKKKKKKTWHREDAREVFKSVQFIISSIFIFWSQSPLWLRHIIGLVNDTWYLFLSLCVEMPCFCVICHKLFVVKATFQIKQEEPPSHSLVFLIPQKNYLKKGTVQSNEIKDLNLLFKCTVCDFWHQGSLHQNKRCN